MEENVENVLGKLEQSATGLAEVNQIAREHERVLTEQGQTRENIKTLKVPITSTEESSEAASIVKTF